MGHSVRSAARVIPASRATSGRTAPRVVGATRVCVDSRAFAAGRAPMATRVTQGALARWESAEKWVPRALKAIRVRQEWLALRAQWAPKVIRVLSVCRARAV